MNMTRRHTYYLVLGASLLAWLFAASVTLYQASQVWSKTCYFLNNWPGCTRTTWGVELGVLAILLGTLVISGLVIFQIFKTVEANELQVPGWIFKIIVAIFLAGSFCVLPFTSNDIHYYFSVGRSVSEGHNPYVEPWIKSVPFFEPAQTSPEQGVMYGPLSLRIFAFMHDVAKGDIGYFIVYWKVLMVLVFVGVYLMVHWLIGNYGGRINTQTEMLFWFSQPLLLWEWVGNGHFDGLWIIPVLGAFVAAKKQSWGLVAVCLAVAIWIKFVPILMVPWFVLWWWQGTERTKLWSHMGEVVRVLVLAGVVTVVSWWHLWGGLQVFNALILQSKWAVSSVFAAAYYTIFPAVSPWLGSNVHLVVTSLVQGTLLGLMIYFLYPYLQQIVKIVTKKMTWTALEYIQAIYISLLAYLLLWQKSFWPWYFAWLIPLSFILFCLRKNNHNTRLLGAIGYFPLLFYVPQQLTEGKIDVLWFFYFVVLVILAYPLYTLFVWRQKKYDLA